MATSIIIENTFEIPLGLRSLDEFRRWTHSAEFPERGRIDYAEERIEVDMSPEDLFTHGAPKGDIYAALHGLVKIHRLGHLFVDRTRVVSVSAGLSAEPDIVFVSRQAIATNSVRLVPKATGAPGRYVELEGAAELVVEIVSDSSEAKDTSRLPSAYYKAGIHEFWLVDARGTELIFQINRRGESGYLAAAEDADGFQRSGVFPRHFRLDRRRDEDGLWEYDLLTKE